MASAGGITFVVRTYNSQFTIARAITSIRQQTIPCRIVVVDSGSSDGTLEFAATAADEVITMPSSDFSFGRALNRGAALADTETIAALSSHCFLPSNTWAETAQRHINDGAAGAWGSLTDANGQVLGAPLALPHEYLSAHKGWGFSNHASAWAARAWEKHPFDEHMIASEDKEWSWRASHGGGHIVADPRLFVPGHHRRSQGARAYYRRLVKETKSLHGHLPVDDYPLVQAVRDWASRHPRQHGITDAKRFGRTRAIEVMARWRAAKQLAR